MGLGKVANEQCYLDVIRRVHRSQRFDLSTALSVQELLYDPNNILVIDAIYIMYVTENPAAASTINIGTVADDDAVVAAYATAASGTAGDITSALTLASALASTRNDRTYGKPLLPAGTALVFKNTASGGAGEIVVNVVAYPLDGVSMK